MKPGDLRFSNPLKPVFCYDNPHFYGMPHYLPRVFILLDIVGEVKRHNDACSSYAFAVWRVFTTKGIMFAEEYELINRTIGAEE